MTNVQETQNVFKTGRLIIPILLGLAVTGFLVYKDFSHPETPPDFSQVAWTFQTLFWFFACFVMMAFRDWGYMIRLRILTDRKLSWRKSFDVIMLWELASALSPSVVGGSGVAMFILNRERITLGRSTAIVLVTAMMDELFYISMVPLCLLIAGQATLFPGSMEKEFFGFTLGIKGIFFVGYGFIFLLTTIIVFALFFFPQGFRGLLGRLFSLPFLKKWQYRAIRTGTEIIVTSNELKGKKSNFWLSILGATFFSWTARFLVINCLIMFINTSADQFLIFGRQMVMWVIMLISPTPGSSGVAELVFNGFLAEFIPEGMAGVLALIWRLISYYPYLIIGLIVFPRWLKRTAA